MDDNGKINVILYGMGSLSNALIRKFSKSERLGKIYILNSENFNREKVVSIGRGKTTKIGEHKKFIKENNIDFVIVNIENYLLSGIINLYKEVIKLPAIGATLNWFILEASKKYCKEFMVQNNIKTPDYALIYDVKSIDEYIKKFGLPMVIKNNYLQSGFGSYICYTESECIKKVKENLLPFCIAEKYIKGSEISLHCAWDGNTFLTLLPVKDFKPFSGKGNVINTGGMGSFAPAVINDKQKKMLEKYSNNLEILFKKLKPDYAGIFVVNLLFTDDELYTLEFNMRPGITEFETLIELFDFDLLEFYYNLANHQLDKCEIKYKENLHSGCIAVTDKSFYDQTEDNKIIIKLPLKELLPVNDNKVLINENFATDGKGNVIVSKKGKFYTVVNTDEDNPFNKIYDYLKKVKCSNVYYRKDIGEIYEKQII